MRASATRDPLFLAARERAVEGPALLAQVERLHDLVQVGGVAVEGVVEVEDLADPELPGQGAGLELGADDGVEGVALGLRIEAHHPHGAGVWGAKPDDALDRRGLAGAIGAEDAEDLAVLDREGHVVDGDRGAVGLAKVGHGDGRFGVYANGGWCDLIVRLEAHVHSLKLLFKPIMAVDKPRG